jgi:D-3-phosphoglycerate dehydrogenase
VRYTARRRADAARESALGVAYATLPDLLSSSSIVSLHLPLSPDTRGLIGAAELAMMPAGSYLLNTSRGELVDKRALREAILSGHLAGAGLDVLEHESAGGNPFTDLPQVIITPHVAGATRGSTAQIIRMAVANVVRFLTGQPPLHLVSPA